MFFLRTCVVWQRHFDVFLKKWKREILLSLYEPLATLLAMVYGVSPLVGEIHHYSVSVSYAEFLAPALIGFGCMFQSLNEAAYSTFTRIHYTRLWQSRLSTSLSFNEVFFGDIIWSASRSTAIGMVLAMGAVAMGIFPFHVALTLLPLLLCAGLMFSALGMLAASTVSSSDQISQLISLVMTPMLFLCGLYFPRTNLPEPLLSIASVLPLSAVLDLLRSHLGSSNTALKVTWCVFLTVAAVCTSNWKLRRRVLAR